MKFMVNMLGNSLDTVEAETKAARWLDVSVKNANELLDISLESLSNDQLGAHRKNLKMVFNDLEEAIAFSDAQNITYMKYPLKQLMMKLQDKRAAIKAKLQNTDPKNDSSAFITVLDGVIKELKDSMESVKQDVVKIRETIHSTQKVIEEVVPLKESKNNEDDQKNLANGIHDAIIGLQHDAECLESKVDIRYRRRKESEFEQTIEELKEKIAKLDSIGKKAGPYAALNRLGYVIERSKKIIDDHYKSDISDSEVHIKNKEEEQPVAVEPIENVEVEAAISPVIPNSTENVDPVLPNAVATSEIKNDILEATAEETSSSNSPSTSSNFDVNKDNINVSQKMLTPNSQKVSHVDPIKKSKTDPRRADAKSKQFFSIHGGIYAGMMNAITGGRSASTPDAPAPKKEAPIVKVEPAAKLEVKDAAPKDAKPKEDPSAKQGKEAAITKEEKKH
jgi:hypothetical protein